MRAALLREVDGPFELGDVPEPEADGKVLVRVRAAGINFADVMVRRGQYPQMPELPAVIGSEIAGELEDGTRVMAITSGGGGYAELVAVERAQVVPLPDHASFAEGASFLLTFLTAYIPLTRQARVRPGSVVLVYAAAGGVGSAAIQVARTLGARVIAAVGSAEKLDVCRSLGAEETFVYGELPEDIGADVELGQVEGGDLCIAESSRERDAQAAAPARDQNLHGRSTTLPTLCRDSTSACACSTSSSGNSAPTSGFNAPVCHNPSSSPTASPTSSGSRRSRRPR